MGRGSTQLDSNEYDAWLSERAKSGNNPAREELHRRTEEKKRAHGRDGMGWHFGLGKEPVKVTSKEEFKHELDNRGLMLEVDVRKDLRGPGKHEFNQRRRR